MGKNKIYDELIDYLKSTISPASLYEIEEEINDSENNITQAEENSRVGKECLLMGGTLLSINLVRMALTNFDLLNLAASTIPGTLAYYLTLKYIRNNYLLNKKMNYADYLQCLSERENDVDYGFSPLNKTDFGKIN